MAPESDLQVLPLHQNPQYMTQCCQLINKEWTRSDTARMYSLKSSCDNLPTSLVLLHNNIVIGHCKLSSIPSIPDACFIESVVIDKGLRSLGYGTYLMKRAEQHCKNSLGLKAVYLSTKGQEPFYSKLGYASCKPISIYGTPSYIKPKSAEIANTNKDVHFDGTLKNTIPQAPPMPKSLFNGRISSKTYMKKTL